MKKYMKNLRKLFSSALIGAMALSMAGCGSKTKISSEDFRSKASELGYTVVSDDDYAAQYSQIESVTIAYDESSGLQIEFYDLTDSNLADSFFDNNEQAFENALGNGSAQNSFSGTKTASFSATDSKAYYCLSRIEDTVVYIATVKDNKDKAKEFMDAIGY